MSIPSFNKVGGAVFGIVAIAHALRVIMGTAIQVGSMDVPMLVSWVGAVVAGALCIWGFRAKP